MSKGIAFCGGGYVPVDEATIALLDPAFTKSDVVFDAVPVNDKAFFRLDDHMERFRTSYEFVRMAPPYADAEMRHIMAQCVERSGLTEAVVFVLCTRGRYGGGVAFGDPRTATNEFIAYAIPYYTIVPTEKVSTGAHIWIGETRRAPDAAINQRVKNFNRMDLTCAQFEAFDHGADAPVLLSMDGLVTEGPGFNVWVIKDRKALTPGDNLLEGITRRTVFDLCAEMGIEAEAVAMTPDELLNAGEAFISSSGGGVIPVTRVNDRPIGNGAPGMTTGQLSELYWKKRAAGWHATPVEDLLEAPEAEIAESA